MTERILDLSTEAAHLKLKMNNIIIERSERDPVSVHLPEIAAVVISHRQVSFTSSALAGITANNGIVVVCDDKSLPVGMMLPLQGNTLQSEKFNQQASASVPVKKKIWKQIVIAKIKSQGRLLKALHKDDYGLGIMATKVKSGDSENMEAQAARRYWKYLFGKPFHRFRDGEDQNRYLNYGYTILRALVTRALCSSGLHPTLGVHHHNRYDTFCLADDIMEPYRSIVDKAVYELLMDIGPEAGMDSATKAALINPLLGRFVVNGEQRTLFDVLTRTSTSLSEVFAGTRQKIRLPEL